MTETAKKKPRSADERAKAGEGSQKKRSTAKAAPRKQGAAKPKPESTKSKLESTKHKPEATKTRPETAKAKSESTKPRLESIKTGPESTKAKAESTKAKPEPTKTRLESSKTKHELKKKRPESAKRTGSNAARGALEQPDGKRRRDKAVSATGSRALKAQGGPGGNSNRRSAGQGEDLFMENGPASRKTAGTTPPPRGRGGLAFLSVCLMIGIAVLVALGVRQQAAYAEFVRMRDVVDQQTFYEGTTIEGVDVSRMTLSDAMAYWGERVEPRYLNRTVTLNNGQTVTSEQLGYASDYASVLSAAWSAGRNGSLEERYRMASSRRQSPVAYSITRRDYDAQTLEQFARQVAGQVDQPVKEADIVSFDTETYEFVFSEAQPGRRLDTEALKRSVAHAIEAGGGNVSLEIETLQPEVSTTEVVAQYGLIDYAITNASSSSKARLKNIKLAMSLINGTRVAPGETFSFNEVVGERTSGRGFLKATAYSGGDVTEQVGGGICQVSTTLFNAAVKADMEIVERHNHSLTVGYVDKGKDATVNWGNQDFKFRNTSDDDIYICCYLTEDKRVRFGIFGKLLPNGESITLDAVTTETVKYETQYIKTPLLPAGQTYLLEPGRNGYKAEAYKVRWDAQGNQLSRELLCKSIYKEKDEIIQYGA